MASPRWPPGLSGFWRRPDPTLSSARAVRLGDARFSFPGFGQAAVDTLLGRFDHRPGAPQAPALVRDVLFAPGLRCLYHADGRRIDETKVTYVEPDAPAWFNDSKTLPIEQATMPERLDPPGAVERVRETVLYLGEAHDHYGHFLTDTLSRAWALDQVGPEAKALFTADPGGRLEAPHVRKVLAWLGLDGARILRPAGPILIDRLLLPTAALQLSRVYDAFQAPHRAAGRRAMAGAPAPPDRPVYLTRSGLGDGLRRPLGEEALERRLEMAGYLVVQPERLSLDAQIALFNGDHPVVGAFGSAMHTVLFRDRPEGPKLATLFPAKIPPRFMMVDVVKGSQAAYASCMTGSGPTWRIDADAAMACLEAEGFLARS